MAFFGFGRLQGKAAQGILTFSLTLAATQDIVLLAGTQAYVPGGSATGNSSFATVNEGRIITTGGTTIDVQARCVQRLAQLATLRPTRSLLFQWGLASRR